MFQKKGSRHEALRITTGHPSSVYGFFDPVMSLVYSAAHWPVSLERFSVFAKKIIFGVFDCDKKSKSSY